MKKCIVFDVDRTMVDSYMPEMLSLKDAIKNATGRILNEDDLKKLTSLTTDEFFKSLNFNSEEISIINKEWEKTFSNYKTICFPGIKKVIKDLYDKGFIIAIITSRTMSEFHELDDELSDILNCFKLIITSDIIKNPKPNTESMEYLCDTLKLHPEDIIYIGDSETDKLFSINSSVDFIPATYENKELEEEENACNTPELLSEKINSMLMVR